MKGCDMKVKNVNFDKYYRNKRYEYAAKLCRLQNSFKGRSVRERPRDVLEEKLLLALDKKRWQKMISSGDLVKINSRHWKLKIS